MLVEISNAPRPYAWGSRSKMAEFLGRRPGGGPEAELWLGAHPICPSRIGSPDAADGHERLDALIAADPVRTLGEDRASDQLPFLMKVLAIAEPLSLQVHPDAVQAARGFAAETRRRVPSTSAARIYKDPWHKPEIVLALESPVGTMVGLKPDGRRRRMLEEVIARAAHRPRSQQVLERWAHSLEGLREERMRHLVGELLATGGAELVGAVTDAVRSSRPVDAADPTLRDDLRALARLVEVRPGDPGILAPVLLNTLSLRAEEAAYIPPGALHAHLEGLAVEVMASSDNVVRGGLTDKHVDARELARILRADPLEDPFCRPERPRPDVAVYRPGEPDFELHLVTAPTPAPTPAPAHAAPPLPASAASATAESAPRCAATRDRGGREETVIDLGGPAIALSIDGSPRVRGATRQLDLPRGHAAFIAADEPVLAVSGCGRLALATTGDVRRR